MSEKHSPSFENIEVIGADANNLKNVDVIFPLKRISVVTGVSGSGKSSLLSDTLAAEGSRRMGIFLGTSQRELERDDVGAFIGAMPPTILVGQRGFRPSIRTTVGTATGFLSILRRLFLLASAPYSESVRQDIPRPSPESYAQWISRNYRGPAEIWAVPIRNHRTDGIAAVRRFAANGVERLIIRSETDPPHLRETGRTVKAGEFKGLNPEVAHTIEALVGTVEVTGPAQVKPLHEILDTAFLASNDSIVVSLPATSNPDLAGPFGPRLDATKHWVHPDVPEIFFRPSVHLLSFNAPEHEDSGACRSCNGTGMARRLREDTLVPYPDRSMSDGAFAIWTEKNYRYVNIQHKTIEGLRGLRGFSPDVSWSKLPASAQALVLNGSGDELVFDRDCNGRKFGAARPFPGFREIILAKSATGTKIADQLTTYVEAGPCDVCKGSRWSFQARSLRVGAHGIAEILAMTFTEVAAFAAVRGRFAGAVRPETAPLVEAIRRHAHSIVSVGLGYLTGDRGMLDVSEGESRRIRLARVLDAGERGLCLLLDEPARGLHESDLSGLAVAMQRMRGEHTIILNEHRERLWEIADWFVELGPKSGTTGGEITFAGNSSNRAVLDDVPLRKLLPVPQNQPRVAIRGATIHNVDNVDCEIPIGRLTCICGVSGSGKSSFVRGVLAPALFQSVGGTASDFVLRQGQWRSLSGTRSIGEVVALDQILPQPNRRSLVATFAHVFDNIRKTFGTSPIARQNGLSATDFGVNAGHGRCPICAGVGEVANAEVWSACPACGGSRYSQAALSVHIDGTNVQDLLEIPVENIGNKAETFGVPTRLVTVMCDLGIGYITLGRRIDTLSGGEVQRLRLAMRLSAEATGSLFFLLDEPAVGLHPRDVRLLGVALNRVLEDARNTVVIVEHDLRLIRSADWVVEFGPGSGPEGGRIVFAGTPEQLARTRTATGLALAGKLPRPKESLTISGPRMVIPEPPIGEQVTRTKALIRTLISGDAPATIASDNGPAEPTVILSERFWSSCDIREVSGLDLEIPKLLLDLQRSPKGTLFTDVLAAWADDGDCWLAIQPFLTEMQVWRRTLPRSVIHEVVKHIARERLRLVTTGGKAAGKDFDVSQVRATGERLIPATPSQENRLRVLHDAFAVGAGYVELRDRAGRLRATASNRLLDLDTAVIAPMVSLPSHFSRLTPRGCCPMCKGTRVVAVISEVHIIGDRDAPPDSDCFLTPEANAVMRGVRQNELRPFLRRLAKEGLWSPKDSFARLDHARRDMILFGFWSRPGPGSFLKTPQANATEVGSWLRWDGLYRRILDQAARSTDLEWVRRINEGTHKQRCILCTGSGLQLFANLLPVGVISYADWARLSDPQRILESLRAVAPRTSRQRRTRQRILHCLAPLARPHPSAKEVLERLVNSFTTMRATEPGELGEG